jgi:hypothetical protein
MYCIELKRGALRGHFIFPRGEGVRVYVVQGTVTALFYTNFTR